MAASREETQAKLDALSAATLRHTPSQSYTVADRFEERAAERGDAPFLHFEDRRLGYAETNALANRVAHALCEAGLRRGDVAALLMQNRPEFPASWLGLAKLGVTVALLNPNVRGRALRHAVEAAGARALIAGCECTAALAGADLPDDVAVFALADPGGDAPSRPPGARDLDAALATASDANPDRSLRAGLVAGDPLFYIYTSGTTGLPKAARWSHMRFLGGADGVTAVVGYRADDVLCCALPLHHGSGGCSLVGCAIASGAAIALRRRFSASRFWDEARATGTTAFQYVGELCRYLVNQPPRPDDRDHRVRIAFGAGLGPDIWETFQQRFGIERIYEGWGATEANTSLLNVDNRPGSVGRVPFPERHNLRLVHYDVETEAHPRDAEGRLVLCGPGEVGEAIGAIPDLPDSGAGRFEGYTSADATEAKILRDVFQEGDRWWRSGDLLCRDDDDYYYFVDRIGDTFRWKSENVSTQEVSEVLSGFPGVAFANVYGVRVPGAEGRAGMAALTLGDPAAFDARAFCAFARERLPAYALPVFLRLARDVSETSTFKLRKIDLQREGYDPAATEDPLYVLDAPGEAYVPLSADALAKAGYPPFAGD